MSSSSIGNQKKPLQMICCTLSYARCHWDVRYNESIAKQSYQELLSQRKIMGGEIINAKLF